MAKIHINCLCKQKFTEEVIGDTIFSCPYCGRLWERFYKGNGQYEISSPAERPNYG